MCLKPVKVKGIFCPCGKCVECLLSRSTEWSYRIMQEASLFEHNCVITLTYNEANLPEGASLKRADLQKFIKRLRKRLEASAIKIRYFYCGEYGKKGARPHYHIIIFNWKPDDLVFFSKDNNGTILYRSAFIEELWSLGYSAIGELTHDTALYCAKYLNKDISIDGQTKSFIGMSTKPLIGYKAINREWLKSGFMYINGKAVKIPRAYLKKLALNPDNIYDLSILKMKRLWRSGCLTTSNYYYKDYNGEMVSLEVYKDEDEKEERIAVFEAKNKLKAEKLKKLSLDYKNYIKNP